MPSMSEIVSGRTDLSEDDHRWLRLLVSEWHLFADLQLLRPGPVGAGPGPQRLLGGGPDPSDHRPDLVVRRRGRRPDRLLARAPGLRRLRQRRGHPDQRGQAARRHPGRRARHPGPARGPGDRGRRAAQEPARRAGAQLPRAGLPGDGGPAGHDDLGRSVPAARRRHQPGLQPAGGRRVHPGRRSWRRRVRQPQRAERVPAAGPDRRPGRRASAHPDRGPVPGRPRTGRRLGDRRCCPAGPPGGPSWSPATPT